METLKSQPVTMLASHPDDVQTLLKASVQLEQHKKSVKEMTAAILQKDAKIQILAGFVREYLNAFEAAFDSDEAQFTYEQMTAYFEAAMYMESAFGRNSKMILRIAKRMNDLPY